MGTELDHDTASPARAALPHPRFSDLVERARAHAFENVFDAVVVTDLSGRIVDWNAGSERLYGYPREEALGRPVSMLHVPEDSEHLIGEVLRHVERDGRWEGEIRMLHRTGRIGWIESMVVPLFDDDGAPVGALGINRDISPRRQVEDELRAAEARFRGLVEHSLVGIFIVGDRGLLYVNPRFVEIFGYSAEELLGEVRIPDLISDEDRPRVLENLGRRFAGEELEEQYTFRGLRKGGQVIDVEVHSSRLDVDGAPAVIGMVQDVTEQRRAEERLHASEERLSGIISHAMEAIIAVDADQRILVFNEAAERTFRCSAKDAIGSSLGRFVPERHREAHREDVRRFGQTGQTRRSMTSPGVIWALRADGEEFPMEAMISRAGEPGKQVFTVILRDISERIRVETALRESEERLRLVVRATNDVIWEWDVTTGALEWSEGAEQTFRYAPETMGRSIEWWSERIQPDERERVVTGLHDLVRGTGDFWSDEYRLMRGDGSYASVLDRGFVRRNERGEALKVIGAMMDVTQRRRNEDAQRFLASASALLESSLDPEVTLPGVARLVVPDFADVCRLDVIGTDGSVRFAAAAEGGGAGQSVPPQGGGRTLMTEVDSALLLESVREGKLVLVSAERGRSLPASGAGEKVRELWEGLGARSLIVAPLRAHHRVLGALTMVMTDPGREFGLRDLPLVEDLARRVAAALENARLYAEAQRAVRAREEILNVVSHDLRNPLGAVQLSAEFLCDPEQRAPEEHRKWLTMILRAADQMDDLIGDLLDAARIDTGGFSVVPASHDVTALLLEVEEVFAPMAAGKDIRLESAVPPALPPVLLDEPLVRRVLSNLINNAIKFTPPGGTIRVQVARDGSELRFSISDDGAGIPRQHLPHVFDRYWQAGRGDRRGVGLGLAIARDIVDAHGGRIWVESEEGSGATFHFTVPLAEAAIPAT
jgi:PAS domain S-box-containing protein